MSTLLLIAPLIVFAALLAFQAWLLGRQLAIVKRLGNLLSLVAHHERGLSDAHVAALRSTYAAGDDAGDTFGEDEP